MIELVYFSKHQRPRKAYHVIQEKPGEPWQIVDGDELIGRMEKMQGLWNLRCWGEIPEGMCMELANLIESQHFNYLPAEIKSHWQAQVHEIIPQSDDEYLLVCKPGIDFERFVKVFSAYVPCLLKDEWPITFNLYDAGMNEDATVSVPGIRR